MSETTKTLACDMVAGCSAPVSHIDDKGYVYCAPHGLDRRGARPCRKLRPYELRRLSRGGRLKRY